MIDWGISNTLPETEGGDRRDAASCACWARVAQLGSETEDMPRALCGCKLSGYSGGLHWGACMLGCLLLLILPLLFIRT